MNRINSFTQKNSNACVFKIIPAAISDRKRKNSLNGLHGPFVFIGNKTIQ